MGSYYDYNQLCRKTELLSKWAWPLEAEPTEVGCMQARQLSMVCPSGVR